jgi:hypothetical protein
VSRTLAAQHGRVAVPAWAAPSRWRALASGATTPDRLWRFGVLLVVACLATALVSLLAGLSRQDAVGGGGTRIAALNTDTAQLYRSLNEADTMASSGLVAGGAEAPSVRARYDDHVARAAARLVHASGLLPPESRDATLVERIATWLPRYTALVESARTQNTQGDQPRAREDLNGASELMRNTLLPAADQLRRGQDAALAANYRDAGGFPVAVPVVALVALACLGYIGIAERRRTNRVLNLGLLASGALLMIGLLWWLGATFLASGELGAARAHSDVTTALDDARVSALQARTAETRSVTAGGDASDLDYVTQLNRLLGAGGQLDRAASAADAASAPGIAAIRAAATQWRDAHARLRTLVAGGDRQQVVASAVGSDPNGSEASFDRLNAALASGLGEQQTELAIDVRRAGATLTGIAQGPAMLALLAAVAAAVGIGRRIWEYR